jgi:hypothetical protein
MKLRLASLLLTLALPLAAQAPAATEAEVMFYKAFYLERGERDFLGAMDLYQKFLDQAPDHKLASKAAQNNFDLLTRTGKLKERDAFRTKYEKLLGNAANAPVPASGERGERGRGAEGRGDDAGRGERPARGAAGRPDAQARIAELERELAKAKEDGNDERVRELEQQLTRARQAGTRGGQAGRGRGGLFGALAGDKKVADMTAEELTALKQGVANFTLPERMKQNMPEEDVKKLEANVAALKTALDANKTEDAQKAMDTLREATRGMFGGRRGGGGDAGGGRGGRGGEGGGGAGGGNRGGGGGRGGEGGGGGGGGGGR